MGRRLLSSTAEEAIAQEGEPRRYEKGRRKERGDGSSSQRWLISVLDGWRLEKRGGLFQTERAFPKI